MGISSLVKAQIKYGDYCNSIVKLVTLTFWTYSATVYIALTEHLLYVVRNGGIGPCILFQAGDSASYPHLAVVLPNVGLS